MAENFTKSQKFVPSEYPFSLVQDGRVNLSYSTPSRYLDALHQADEEWDVEVEDFFPYAHCPHCYWTGYFTSRPALKWYIRESNNILQVCSVWLLAVRLEVEVENQKNVDTSYDILITLYVIIVLYKFLRTTHTLKASRCIVDPKRGRITVNILEIWVRGKD